MMVNVSFLGSVFGLMSVPESLTPVTNFLPYKSGQV